MSTFPGRGAIPGRGQKDQETQTHLKHQLRSLEGVVKTNLKRQVPNPIQLKPNAQLRRRGPQRKKKIEKHNIYAIIERSFLKMLKL